MAFRRRMAGAELAAHPLTDVGQQLNEARGSLRRAMVAANPDIMGTGDVPYNRGIEAPSFDEGFDIKGHHVGLHAQANPVSFGGISELGPLEKAQMGDKATYDILAANPPSVEYNMSWDVDHSYGDSNVGGRDAIAIGRATQKKWNEIIGKMPENALVANSPVGAHDGDFKRADIYMASGFGPVQVDGNQYGIVKGGQIIPLSPLAVQDKHAKHLAGRARMAGEVKLGDDVMTALSAPGRSELVDWSGSENADLAGRKNGFYDGRYDESYDDDYVPPVTPRDLRQTAGMFKGDIQQGRSNNSGQGIPEIGIRRELEREESYRGLDGEITASDIQDLREAQVAMMRQDAPGRQLIDQVNEVMPRPLPQQITTNDLGYTERHYGGIDGLPATERRRRGMERVRREADDAAVDFRTGGFRGSNFEDVRDNLKDNSLDIDRTGESGVAFAQELFEGDDIGTLRELQRVMAQNGMKSSELPYRDRTIASRRSTYRENPNLVRPNEPVNYLQPRNAQQDADMDVAIAMDNRNSREREVLELVDERFAPDTFEGRPRLVHNIYGAQTVDQLLANNPASPRMQQLTNDQALSMVARSVHQPGTTDPQEFADALRVVQGFAGDNGGGDIVQRVFNEVIRQPAGQPVNSNFGNINPVDLRNPEFVEQARPPRGRRRRTPQQMDDYGERVTPRAGVIDSPVANNPAFEDLLDSELQQRASRRSSPVNPDALQRGSMLPPRNSAHNRRSTGGVRRQSLESTAMQAPSTLVAPPRNGTGLGGAMRQQDAMVQQARQPSPRLQTADAAPEGMSLDQFLAWNDRANGVQRGQRRNPQPSRPRRSNSPEPAAASWNDAPLIPDTDDIPF